MLVSETRIAELSFGLPPCEVASTLNCHLPRRGARLGLLSRKDCSMVEQLESLGSGRAWNPAGGLPSVGGPYLVPRNIESRA